MSDQCQKYDLRILSRREEFGVVAPMSKRLYSYLCGEHSFETLDKTILDVNGIADGIGSEDCKP